MSQAPIGQNYMCIVYHDQNLPADHRHRLNVRLKKKIHYIRIFNDVGEFSEYLISSFVVEKLFIVISGDDAKYLCQNIENDKEYLHDPLVYELQSGATPLKSGLSEDRRFLGIDPLINKIETDLKEHCPNTTIESQQVKPDEDIMDSQEELFPLGIHEYSGRQRTFRYPSTEEHKFILFQSFIEMLLKIQYNDQLEADKALERMWTSFRRDPDYRTNGVYLQRINDYQRSYTPASSIQTYTRSSFFFRAVNKVFRYEDLEKIFHLQPFIAHIYEQLQHLRTQQQLQAIPRRRMLRRGKKFPASVLQQLKDNKGNLVSINGFLSTTTEIGVADVYAGTGTNRPGYQSVLFEIYVDETIHIQRPYANLSGVSEIPADQEVLFFAGFVWRIMEVDIKDDQPTKVTLELSIDMESAIRERFNKLGEQCTFFGLGKILHELGEYKKAINFYDRMFNSRPEILDKKILAKIHYYMAISAFEDESSSQAFHHIQEAERLMNEVSRLVENQPILAEDASFTMIRILINKGLIYRMKEDYERARETFGAALERQGSENDKAYVHYYLGVLQREEGNYEMARIELSTALGLTTDEALGNTINGELLVLNRTQRTTDNDQREPMSN